MGNHTPRLTIEKHHKLPQPYWTKIFNNPSAFYMVDNNLSPIVVVETPESSHMGTMFTLITILIGFWSLLLKHHKPPIGQAMELCNNIKATGTDATSPLWLLKHRTSTILDTDVTATTSICRADEATLVLWLMAPWTHHISPHHRWSPDCCYQHTGVYNYTVMDRNNSTTICIH